MKRILLLLGFLLSLAAAAQDYEADWNNVLDLEAEGIVKRAADETEKIYQKAKKDRNEPQLIKTFFFRAKYMQVLEEDAQVKIIASLRAEKETMSVPGKAIMESLYGQLLNRLFRQNSYNIGQRTPIADGVPTDDITLWGRKEYENAIEQAYGKSIAQRELLYNTPLEKYDAIIEMDVRLKATKRSLYDFLAETYLRHLENTTYLRIYDTGISPLFGDTLEFTGYSYNGENREVKAIFALYQELERFYSSKKDTLSLQRAVLRRLEFATTHSNHFEYAAAYRETLEHYAKAWEGSPFVYNARLELARRYVAEADKKKSPDNLLKALELCNGILLNAREATCTDEAIQLRNSLISQHIGIWSESYITPGRPSLAKVDFKNMSSFRLRIFRMPIKNGSYGSFHQGYVKNREMVLDTVYSLPVKHDLFQYSTEIILPPLETGTYLVDALPVGAAGDEDHAVITIHATNMGMIEQELGNNNTYQVVDRLTGKPLKKIKGYTATTTGYTDARGRLAFESDYTQKHSEVNFVHKGDTISTSFYNDSRYNYGSDDEDEEYHASTRFFTDRAIYRPGQKMFFKGVVIKEQNGVQSPVTGIYIPVVLQDPSGNEAGSMRVHVNEYGSFTGEFTLPKTGLTGEYHLIAEEDYDYEEDEHPFWDDDNLDFEESEHRFFVEEYKRPAFEANFDDITDTVMLNDTITAKGNARSFSDAPIGGAKVTYTVTRTVHHIRRDYTRAEPAVLATGTVLTDADGTFRIPFKAEPDADAGPEEMPVFLYDVKADITDINGETHSAQQMIRAGYHLLNVSVTAPGTVENGTEKITLDTKNLNGHFIPAKGKVEIYKVKKESSLTERPWPSPDIQEIPRDTFGELFPFTPFENIDNNSIITKKNVLTASIDTGQLKTMALTGFEDWEAGRYQAIFTVVDSAGYTLEATANFNVRKIGARMLAEEGIFDFRSLNNNPRKDGYAKFELRSPLPAIYVNVETYKDGSNTYGITMKMKDGKAIVKVPIDKKYTGITTVTFDFVWQAQLHHDDFTTDQDAAPSLEIEATSIASKFLPGSKETWSFAIKGSENFPAEVLASMYDTSVDEFAKSYWRGFDSPSSRYYDFGNTVPEKEFLQEGRETGRFSNLENRPAHQAGDHLNQFGFDINYDKLRLDAEASQRKREKKALEDGGKVIYGTVADEAGELPGASINVRGTERWTVSDIDGYYSIAALPGEILEFHYAGYDSQSVIVGAARELNVLLESQSLKEVTIDAYRKAMPDEANDYNYSRGNLEEVRIEAYGNGSPNKSSISFYVTTSEGIEDRANASVLQSLQGQVAGLSITTGSGTPGADSTIILRGVGSINGNVEPLFIVDGIPLDEDGFRSISQGDIFDIKIYKDAAATSLYGNRGANGVIVITTKLGMKEELAALEKVKTRKNLNETAFFYPQLLTDKKGNLSFTFTSPEALTQWKLRLFAHDKKAVSGYYESLAITQKDLMVTPNMPRFLREKDTIVITAKVTNLTADSKTGNAMLQLFDAVSMEPIDAAMNNTTPMQPFTIPAKGSTTASWRIAVPSGVQGVQYKVVAKTGNFTDGEENILPVLTNSMLVTESIPIWVKPNTTKEYTLENLKNNTSTTLRHQGITLEYTSNPVWLALQSLPYLMEYEHECAEQVFSRYYADALATHVMNSNPKISALFAEWKKEGKPLSKLAQNEELKSVIMAESPWLLDTESDEEQKCRLAVLFDLDRMKGTMAASLSKLEDKQLASGGFPWFEGGQESEYITRHILAGLGHLEKLGAMSGKAHNPANLVKKGVAYIDGKFMEYHRTRQDVAKKDKKFSIIHPYSDLHYLYTRSFYLKGYIPDDSLKKAINTHLEVVKDKWLDYSLYEKGMAALALHRFGDTITAKKVVASLKETSANNEEWGMYWIANKPGWWWYQAPIETQALLIEAFAEVDKDTVSVDAMKVWLIKQKQNKNWPTTKSTAEAVYALMLQGTAWLSVQDATEIQYGDSLSFAKKVSDTGKEAGTGYMKLQWKAEEVDKSLATLQIENKGKVPGYGGLYWQYFEELDKIPSAQAGLMNVEKELYLKTTTLAGTELKKITAGSPLKIGDLVTVRLVVTLKEDAEYVHLKDMRASAFEPVDVLSGYHHRDGLGFYRSTRDAATHFFFDSIRKGTYILEYDVRVNNAGEFSNGITTIQSMYAPEFSGHTKGIRVKTEH